MKKYGRKTREDRDGIINLLINELEKKGTQISSEYMKKLAKYVQKENVDAIGFMKDLVTQLSDLRMRINKLEQSLNIEKNID